MSKLIPKMLYGSRVAVLPNTGSAYTAPTSPLTMPYPVVVYDDDVISGVGYSDGTSHMVYSNSGIDLGVTRTGVGLTNDPYVARRNGLVLSREGVDSLKTRIRRVTHGNGQNKRAARLSTAKELDAKYKKPQGIVQRPEVLRAAPQDNTYVNIRPVGPTRPYRK